MKFIAPTTLMLLLTLSLFAQLPLLDYAYCNSLSTPTYDKVDNSTAFGEFRRKNLLDQSNRTKYSIRYYDIELIYGRFISLSTKKKSNAARGFSLSLATGVLGEGSASMLGHELALPDLSSSLHLNHEAAYGYERNMQPVLMVGLKDSGLGIPSSTIAAYGTEQRILGISGKSSGSDCVEHLGSYIKLMRS